jgi:hypothetical protein
MGNLASRFFEGKPGKNNAAYHFVATESFVSALKVKGTSQGTSERVLPTVNIVNIVNV